MIGIKTILRRASGLVGMCLLLGVINAQAATLTVTTTADAGRQFAPGTYRRYCKWLSELVTFNVPTTDLGYDAGTNRFTINLLSQLPDLPLAPDNRQQPSSGYDREGQRHLSHIHAC